MKFVMGIVNIEIVNLIRNISVLLGQNFTKIPRSDRLSSMLNLTL